MNPDGPHELPHTDDIDQPMEMNMTTKTKPEISAAEIARKLGVSPREARVKLRAAGIRAPYAAKDVARITAIIKGEAPAKRKADTPKGKRKSETRTDDPSD